MEEKINWETISDTDLHSLLALLSLVRGPLNQSGVEYATQLGTVMHQRGLLCEDDISWFRNRDISFE